MFTANNTVALKETKFIDYFNNRLFYYISSFNNSLYSNFTTLADSI